MNALQLVSKIRSKTEDLTQNIHDLLAANHSFSGMDKELLKKQCLDLYELLLKLKADSELIEEKHNYKQIHLEPEPVPETLPETKIDEPAMVTSNFQEVINWADEQEETLDEIVNKVELKMEEPIPSPSHTAISELVLGAEIPLEDFHPRTNPETTVLNPVEINIGKATENKRIQYTVMPAIEEPKPNPLNLNFRDKEPTYNEKIAQVNPPVAIPMADKTIEAPIENIKLAINLNKKIAFVNELFRENVVEYAKAIDRLNNASDRNDAFRIHNELKHQYQWDNQHELVQDLERLIRRRFA